MTSPRVPWATLTVVAAALSAALFPQLAALFEDRIDAIESFELWRLVSGSLAHAGSVHLLLNLTFFVPLAVLRERGVGSRRAALDFALLFLAVAVGIRVLPPAWSTYRGLSGAVYGLLVLCAWSSAETTTQRNSVLAKFGPAFSITALAAIAKTALECIQGGWLSSASSLGDSIGVRYLPGSHLGGITIALIVIAGSKIIASSNQDCSPRTTPPCDSLSSYSR